VRLDQPDWSNSSHSLGFSADFRRERLLFHVILNAYWEPLDFELPPAKSSDPDPWRRWIDTALESPQDITDWRTASSVPGFTYRAGPRSVVILFADLRDGTSPGLSEPTMLDRTGGWKQGKEEKTSRPAGDKEQLPNCSALVRQEPSPRGTDCTLRVLQSRLSLTKTLCALL